MARNEWNSYRLDDGLNIWGAPSFLGIPEFAGGLTHGDEVLDTLVMNGRIATGSIAGAAIDIDSSYTYDQLVEIKADVSDWTNIPGAFFTGQHSRISTSGVGGTVVYGIVQETANGPAGGVGVNISFLQSFLFNVMGKGGSTIGTMRGGEIKCEWAADDIVTDAVGLTIEFMGLAAPANTIIGLKFEKASAAGAMVPFFHEIQMKEGLHIISRTATPVAAGIIAPQGSLCLVTTGDSVATCAFINTDGADAWTAFT